MVSQNVLLEACSFGQFNIAYAHMIYGMWSEF
jgi:hypothetical protein